MKVYLVQKRYWQFNDDYYILRDCIPTKVFASKDDAEAFRILQELAERDMWSRERGWFLGEQGPCPSNEYPLFEIVEAELHE